MEDKRVLKRFGARVGYTGAEMEQFGAGDPRLRQISRLARAAARYSIQAEVVRARNCNSGYQEGDKFILDVDGNFITKFCPPRFCVYAMSQLVVPVALINERLSEGLDPSPVSFHAPGPLPGCGGRMRWLRRSDAANFCSPPG
jgi:uncharacterized repeat protein (TIGR04076 family)